MSETRAATRVLFLTRRYPPSRGGAQTHAFKLYTYLDQRAPTHLIALKAESVLHLAWFMPLTFLRAAIHLLLGRADIVYFADGVVASVAWALTPFKGRAKFCCSLFGLEMTFGNRWARNLMGAGVRRCDGIAVISDNSLQIAAKTWNLAPRRMRLIYLGAEPEELPEDRDAALRQAFEQKYGIDFDQDRVVLNLGRQVPRKGVAAFVKQGLALLDPDIKVLIVGGGPDAVRIAAGRDKLEHPERVLLLGVLDDDVCSMLRRHCDLFLMPNVTTPGDVEGYGIAPLEAMYFGTPVVAFAVDALVEAVREGGWLVPPGDYQGFAETVHAYYALSPAQRTEVNTQTREYCLREYGWDTASARYAELFEEIRS